MNKTQTKPIEETESMAERIFAARWVQLNMMGEGWYPQREVQFDTVRKWRFDFAWVSTKVAVEIEGGVFINGHHTRGKGYQLDCEKYNRALELGWRVLRYTPQMVAVDPEKVIRQIENVLRS